MTTSFLCWDDVVIIKTGIIVGLLSWLIYASLKVMPEIMPNSPLGLLQIENLSADCAGYNFHFLQ